MDIGQLLMCVARDGRKRMWFSICDNDISYSVGELVKRETNLDNLLNPWWLSDDLAAIDHPFPTPKWRLWNSFWLFALKFVSSLGFLVLVRGFPFALAFRMCPWSACVKRDGDVSPPNNPMQILTARRIPTVEFSAILVVRLVRCRCYFEWSHDFISKILSRFEICDVQIQFFSSEQRDRHENVWDRFQEGGLHIGDVWREPRTEACRV